MKDVLIVFARYPELGKCKTRLIPHLGAERATELHRQMTRRALQIARDFSDQSNVRVEVHFAGGDAAKMSECFGSGLNYVIQSEGDLGIRLRTAFNQLFEASAERIVVIGTDCPQLTVDILRTAFDRLNAHHVCIAPATDGGYTLLGIGRSLDAAASTETCNAVFHKIDWGSERVLTQTLTRIHEAGLRCSLLSTLSDIDTAADLPVWETANDSDPSHQPRVSVVIPTLNDEPLLTQAIESARACADAEVIVVAAGNASQALRVAVENRAQLLHCDPGRSSQMNLGAQAARSDTLLFLHADTILPAGYLDSVCSSLARESVVGGAFKFRINSARWQARVIELGTHVRASLCSTPYGDQAIFVRKATFKQLGGFPDMPIMEDYIFVRRLRRVGRIAIDQQFATTSARRWEKLGFLRTTIINQCMLLGYACGFPVDILANFYRRRQKRSSKRVTKK